MLSDFSVNAAGNAVVFRTEVNVVAGRVIDYVRSRAVRLRRVAVIEEVVDQVNLVVFNFAAEDDRINDEVAIGVSRAGKPLAEVSAVCNGFCNGIDREQSGAEISLVCAACQIRRRNVEFVFANVDFLHCEEVASGVPVTVAIDVNPHADVTGNRCRSVFCCNGVVANRNNNRVVFLAAEHGVLELEFKTVVVRRTSSVFVDNRIGCRHNRFAQTEARNNHVSGTIVRQERLVVVVREHGLVRSIAEVHAGERNVEYRSANLSSGRAVGLKFVARQIVNAVRTGGVAIKFNLIRVSQRPRTRYRNERNSV